MAVAGTVAGGRGDLPVGHMWLAEAVSGMGSGAKRIAGWVRLRRRDMCRPPMLAKNALGREAASGYKVGQSLE